MNILGSGKNDKEAYPCHRTNKPCRFGLVLPPMRQGRSPAKGHRQSTRPAKAPVTDPLAIVLDKRQPTSVQIREIDRLPSNLSEVNQKAILDFIRTAANGHGEYVVKNNLMPKIFYEPINHRFVLVGELSVQPPTRPCIQFVTL